ncbi:MAG: YgaP family membrane protein [Rhodovulum sp.]
MLKKNVGGVDRMARIGVGAMMLLIWAFMTDPSPLWLIGIVPLATGLLSSCPLYNLIGLNTCPTK